jgi:AcrR family transcriptional regulator
VKASAIERTALKIGLNDATRSAEILREAAKLFAAKGYDGTSVQDIAQAVGISKASLYHFFADKSEIHSTVVVMALSRLIELVKETIEFRQTASDRVEGFARAHAQYISEHKQFYFAAALGFYELADPEVKARVHSMRDGYEEILRGIIREGIEAGEFRDLDVRLAARAVMSCMNWMARWWRPDGPETAEKIASDYVHLIIRGFLPR